MRKRILVVGPGGSGKSTLCHYLEGNGKEPRSTHEVVFGKFTIDTPGSYIDNPSMYQHIISLALNYASGILMVVDADSFQEKYPPGFAKIFNCWVVGVATKCTAKNRARADGRFAALGIESPRFYIGQEKEGLEMLKEYLTLNGELG